jgi:hypothetical protein
MQLESWTSFLTVTLLIFIGVVLYRRLLHHFSKGRIKPEDYCILYDLELQEVVDNVEFYFTLPNKTFVTFEILNKDWQVVEELEAKHFESGGHIVRLNAVDYPSGEYFYGIRTEVQKMYKKFRKA